MTAPRGVLGRLVRTEVRLAWREPVGLAWGLGMPVLLVVIFGNITAFGEPIPAWDGLTVFDAYLPVLMILSLSMLGLIGLPLPLATYRELGVLRRMSTTPVSPSRLLAAQLVVNLAVAAVAVGLVLAIGAVLGGRMPTQVPEFLVALVLTAAALFGLGLVVAAVARTSRAAAALGNVLFFPLAFFGGLWLPRPAMPELLQQIGGWTPTGAAADALTAAVTGTGLPAVSAALLAGYALVFGLVALRVFRWE